MAVDSEGDVYVSDWGSNGTNPGRVQIYDSEGQFITGLIGDSVELSKWGQIQVDSNPDTQNGGISNGFSFHFRAVSLTWQ